MAFRFQSLRPKKQTSSDGDATRSLGYILLQQATDGSVHIEHQIIRSLVFNHSVTSQPGLKIGSLVKSRPVTDVDSPWRRKHL